MRVLFAPDKFKGSLTALEAATAMADGWRTVYPHAEVILRPVADGGEGSAEAVCAAAGQWVEHEVNDPLGRPVRGGYALMKSTGAAGYCAAFVECSSASGYLRLKPHERDLLRASTFGTGQLIARALAQPEVEQVIVGLGGSATNDGGVGMAAALGYEFLDGNGDPILPRPHEFDRLATIVPPSARPWLRRPVTGACDVRNPLLGPRGATRIYGPQKGMQPAQEAALETGLQRLAEVALSSLGTDDREAPGAGAAGGLGYGLLTFCRARLEPGFGLVARLVGLEDAMAAADLVVTGEGASDAQSLEGKAPCGVAAMARGVGKSVILVAGTILPVHRTMLSAHFDAVHAMTDIDPDVQRCMHDAANILRQTAAGAAADWRNKEIGSA